MPRTEFLVSKGNNEARLGKRIEKDIAAAQHDDCPITVSTAQLIAASVHRGLASELARFASTGAVPTGRAYQVMRLELDLATRDEPLFAAWVDALKTFFSEYTRAFRDHPAGKKSATKFREVRS